MRRPKLSRLAGITATVAGQTYQIPAMWLAGATRTRTYPEAIQVWHEQAQAERQMQGNP